MKRTLTILALLAALGLWSGSVLAQTTGNGFGVCGFVDENGDGFNDLAPDADGDGIPNGMDPDYVKPLDGTGQQYGFGGGAAEKGLMGQGTGNHYGPGDGTGFGGMGPADGTGFGPGTGTGDCDGTGPTDKIVHRMGRR